VLNLCNARQHHESLDDGFESDRLKPAENSLARLLFGATGRTI
jgi:hypothetical protein